MPIYDYKCGACETCFERSHPMKDPPIRICPECGKEAVRKVFSTGGIQVSSGSSQMSNPSPPSCATGGCGMPSMCGM